MMDQRYLFITGCARSGTTALAQLVGSHNNIIMGIERFGCLVSPKNFTMTKDHFKFDRFFDVKPGDTFYNNFDDFHKWDSNIRNKIKTVKYIGDKRPDLYHVYDKLFAEFENAKVLFIYRNIYDIAISWNKRAYVTKDWSTTRDFKKAVIEWNQSLIKTINAKSLGQNIIPVNYENIFIKNIPIDIMYKALDLEVDEITKKNYTKLMVRSRKLNNIRKKYTLTSEQREFIDEHSCFENYEKIKKFSLI